MNSRVEITTLTVIARENTEYAHGISEVLQEHIKKVSCRLQPQTNGPLLSRLSVLYSNHLSRTRLLLNENCRPSTSSTLSSRTSAPPIQSTLAAASTRPSWTLTPPSITAHGARWTRCSRHGRNRYPDPWTLGLCSAQRRHGQSRMLLSRREPQRCRPSTSTCAASSNCSAAAVHTVQRRIVRRRHHQDKVVGQVTLLKARTASSNNHPTSSNRHNSHIHSTR